MMKNLIKTLAFAVMLVALGTTAQAQQKIAYIHTDSLIFMMPESKKADSAVNIEVAKYEKEMERRQAKVTEEQKKYEGMVAANGGKEGTGFTWDLARQDYQEAVEKVQKLQENAQTEIPKIRQKQYEPIIEKAKKAIAEVAKEKGYTYVLDGSVGAIIYYSPNDNIMDDVKKKLGIK